MTRGISGVGRVAAVALGCVVVSAIPAPAFARSMSIATGCDAPAFVKAVNDALAAPAGVLVGIVLRGGCDYSLTKPFLASASGLPRIARHVEILGNGATISRDPTAPPFRIIEVAEGGHLVLDDITLKAGSVTGAGGAIVNQGTVELTAARVTGNSATGPDGKGGGIANFGTLNLARTDVTDNTATSNGGGIHSQGTVHVQDSHIDRNTATQGTGGGIDGLDHAVRVFGGTINNNIAGGDGGGIRAGAATITVDGTTISGNTSQGLGGGAYAAGLRVELTNDTITANRAANSGGVHSHPLAVPDAFVTMRGSAITGNTPNNCTGRGCPAGLRDVARTPG